MPKQLKHRHEPGPAASGRGYGEIPRDQEAGNGSHVHGTGVQSKRVRSGTVAALMLGLLVLVGVVSILHFAHIGAVHSTQMPGKVRMASEGLA